LDAGYIRFNESICTQSEILRIIFPIVCHNRLKRLYDVRGLDFKVMSM